MHGIDHALSPILLIKEALNGGGCGLPTPEMKVVAPDFRGTAGAAEDRRRWRSGQGGVVRRRGSAPAAGVEAGGSAGSGGSGGGAAAEFVFLLPLLSFPTLLSRFRHLQ